jgi:ATP-dependent protease ClpP protease subunit
VCILNIGLATSRASLILVGGAIPRQAVFLHARVMIHQPSTSYFSCKGRQNPIGNKKKCVIFIAHIAKIYVQNIDQPINVIQNDLETYTLCPQKKLRIIVLSIK